MVIWVNTIATQLHWKTNKQTNNISKSEPIFIHSFFLYVLRKGEIERDTCEECGGGFGEQEERLSTLKRVQFGENMRLAKG